MESVNFSGSSQFEVMGLNVLQEVIPFVAEKYKEIVQLCLKYVLNISSQIMYRIRISKWRNAALMKNLTIWSHASVKLVEHH